MQPTSRSFSSHRQVILITHLPQIAAFADNHLKIMKRVEGGRTKALVIPLKDQNEKVEELAHIGQAQMQVGDVFEVSTPGGGGFG